MFLITLLSRQFTKHADDVAAVYLRAFDLPDTAQSIIMNRLHSHSQRQDFRGVIAVGDEAQVLGFSYGYIGSAGQYWHDLVRAQLDPQQAGAWMEGAFEVVELAVDPRAQGQGLGGALLTRLLGQTSADKALLTVRLDNLPARRLYDKEGWTLLVEQMQFSGQPEDYAVMGKRLPRGE